MAKTLCAIDNKTDISLRFVVYDGGVAPDDTWSVPLYCFGLEPNSFMDVASLAGTVSIPDDSDPAHWFNTERVEVQDQSGKALFCFWGNDDSPYLLQWCTGDDFISGTPNYTDNGTDTKNNSGDTGVLVSGTKGSYQIAFYGLATNKMPRSVANSLSLNVDLTQTKTHGGTPVNKNLNNLTNLTICQLNDTDQTYVTVFSNLQTKASDSFLQRWYFATTATYPESGLPSGQNFITIKSVIAGEYFSTYYNSDGTLWQTGTQRSNRVGKSHDFIFSCQWDGNWTFSSTSIQSGTAEVPCRWMIANGGEDSNSQPGSDGGPGSGDDDNASWTASAGG